GRRDGLCLQAEEAVSEADEVIGKTYFWLIGSCHGEDMFSACSTYGGRVPLQFDSLDDEGRRVELDHYFWCDVFRVFLLDATLVLRFSSVEVMIKLYLNCDLKRMKDGAVRVCLSVLKVSDRVDFLGKEELNCLMADVRGRRDNRHLIPEVMMILSSIHSKNLRPSSKFVVSSSSEKTSSLGTEENSGGMEKAVDGREVTVGTESKVPIKVWDKVEDKRVDSKVLKVQRAHQKWVMASQEGVENVLNTDHHSLGDLTEASKGEKVGKLAVTNAAEHQKFLLLVKGSTEFIEKISLKYLELSQKFDAQIAQLKEVEYVAMLIGEVVWKIRESDIEMVKTHSMALEERIASEMQRLKLKFFGDQSMEDPIPAPVTPTLGTLSLSPHPCGIQGWEDRCRDRHDSGRVQTRSQGIRSAAKGRLVIKISKMREKIFGSLGYDAKLPVRECQLEGLDSRSRELEYAQFFFEGFFRELVYLLVTVFQAIKAVLDVIIYEANGVNLKIALLSNLNPSCNLSIPELISLNLFLEWLLVVLSKNHLLQIISFIIAPKLKLLTIATKSSWSFKPGPRLQVTRKESLLDKVVQEETELEAVLEDLGISRKKRVNNRVEKVQKSHSTRLMTSAGGRKNKGTDGERQANLPKAPRVDTGLPESITLSKLARTFPKRQMLKRPGASRAMESGEAAEKKKKRRAASLMKGICLRIEEERAELKKKKAELERRIARLKSDLSKEGKRLEALKASQVVKINKLRAEERVDLDEVEAIRTDTYVEEEEAEDDVVGVGVLDRLDGMSPRTVELESARLCEVDARQCNHEFAEEFDRMREANKNREDQHVKMYFKFVEATKTAVDLAQQIEESDTKIEKGQKELEELKEHAAKLKSQNDAVVAYSPYSTRVSQHGVVKDSL
ncbi:hypothetical protein GIB67_035323, partial [Kingdonia uniflora]